MSLATFARKSLGGLFRMVSDHLLHDNPTNGSPTNGHHVEPEPPSRPRKPYNPKEHKTYYLVGSTVLRLMLDNPGSKTVKDLVALSSEEFPQSTIRGICKELVKEGLLTQVADYPASFVLVEDRSEQALLFVADHLPQVEAHEEAHPLSS